MILSKPRLRHTLGAHLHWYTFGKYPYMGTGAVKMLHDYISYGMCCQMKLNSEITGN